MQTKPEKETKNFQVKSLSDEEDIEPKKKIQIKEAKTKKYFYGSDNVETEAKNTN